MILHIHPDADNEGAEAAHWYEKRQVGLGDIFLTEWERALGTIRMNPQSLSRLEDYTGSEDIRRFLMRRFPYMVIILCRSDEVVIVAVSHLHRRPLYWLDRLEG